MARGVHFLSELRATMEAQPERPALVYQGRSFTYGELNARAIFCAAVLQSLGVERGDRVALFTPGKLPLLVAHLGAMYAGGVPLPLNPRLTREEMRYYLTDARPRVVVAGADQQAMLAELAGQLPAAPIILPDEAALDGAAGRFREPTVNRDDPCLILYSSGTTGWPKGIVHTHANAASALCALADCWQLAPSDVVVNMLPLFHIHGLAFATQATWLAGGLVRIEDGFDAHQALEAIGQGTVFMAVPPMYYRLLDEPRLREAARAWSRVRLFTCGSAPIRPEVLPELEEILGRPVINRYGMTEAHVITSLPLAGPWPAGSVGSALAGIELRVIQGDGSPAPEGEVGSVVLRGPNLFREYWQQPDATRAAFATGWFDTGDLGTLDPRGFLTLVGRKHDLIITSGYNVYPQVVERVIGECPGVGQCAVVGIPDQDRGEEVVAAIVRSDATLDQARLSAWCSDRLIHYQRPRRIIFVESLPRNSLGKLLRRELRELFVP
ncbi:MAG: acyl--CoA ligase [Planctomycetaceae bacterium]|nr:acyl--CoA ligase [Planctomycetaceae bacterium]